MLIYCKYACNVTTKKLISIIRCKWSDILDLNKLEKPYLDAHMNLISSKSVHQFARCQKCV